MPTDNSIYVSFRGTESLDNWLVDADAFKMNYTTWPECADCEVHAGFYKAVKSVESDIISEVSRLKTLYPSYAVKSVGHSLGAALAHLTALSLLKNGFETSLLNFGQPRVGNKAFAAFSQSVMPNQWRVVHHKDIVPHSPSMDWPQSYHHTFHEMYEDDSGIRQCDDSGEDFTCSD